jgi:hypothetical protein
MKFREALKYRKKIEDTSKILDDSSALERIELFPLWQIGINVTAGERYRYKDVLYRVIQSHKTQSD